MDSKSGTIFSRNWFYWASCAGQTRRYSTCVLITSFNLISQAIIGLIRVQARIVPMLYYTLYITHIIFNLFSLIVHAYEHRSQHLKLWCKSISLSPRILLVVKINVHKKVGALTTILSGRFCFLNYAKALLRKYTGISWQSLYKYFIGNDTVVSELHWLIPNSMAT